MYCRPQFMEPPRFDEACDEILRFQDNRNAVTQRTVVMLLPTIANYKPDIFVGKYLNQCMVHLINMLKRDRERSAGMCTQSPWHGFLQVFGARAYGQCRYLYAAFMAIGELSLAVGHHMEKYLPDLVQNVKEYFSVKRCGVARTGRQMPCRTS
jgi:hypothetical protein